MGVGIASMHYTAMAAASFMPGDVPSTRHTVEVSTLGAFGIGVTTLLLLYTQVFVIRAYCEYCLLSAGMTLTLAALVVAARFVLPTSENNHEETKSVKEE